MGRINILKNNTQEITIDISRKEIIVDEKTSQKNVAFLNTDKHIYDFVTEWTNIAIRTGDLEDYDGYYDEYYFENYSIKLQNFPLKYLNGIRVRFEAKTANEGVIEDIVPTLDNVLIQIYDAEISEDNSEMILIDNQVKTIGIKASFMASPLVYQPFQLRLRVSIFNPDKYT